MPQLYWNDPWSNIAYQNSVDTSDAIDIYDEEVNGEEVTTDEFDRFLKKRVEAATKKETEVR